MAVRKNLLIVFDLVATLTDASPRYVRAFEQACKKHGYDAPKENEVAAMLGNKNLKQITEHFIGNLSKDEEKNFMQSCNETCDAMLFDDDWQESLFPDVKETLAQLKEDGYALGIYTGTRENALRDQMQYHDITGLFNPDYLRGKDNKRDAGIDSHKLKAMQLESIIETFRKDQNDPKAPVLIIGDSSADAKAAQELGFFFVGFAAKESKQKKLEECGVKNIMTAFKDLPKIIQQAQSQNRPVAKKKQMPKF